MSDPSAPLTSTTEFYQPVQVWTVAPPRQRYWLHALLLLATFLSMLIVGARMEDNFLHNEPVFSLHQNDGAFAFFPVSWLFTQPARVLLGLPFSLTLILILFAHEMGHYLYCRHYGVNATLPFFIPAPTLFGTFGAFIRIRGPIRSRTALFDIGIAGPIAGFVVALLALAFSLGLSKPLSGGIPEQEVRLGYPLIFSVVQWAVNFLSPAHPLASLPAVYLHPVAVAAWVGMFATALNLLPGGQLDGGHIVFSIAPRAHKFISRLTILILIPLAVYQWTGWLIWAILLEISSFRHPQVADWPRVRGVRAWLAVFGLIMLILTLAPAPLADSSLLEVVRLWRGH